jgi:L,D-transpeptidase catalytic domain/SPOR domain
VNHYGERGCALDRVVLNGFWLLTAALMASACVPDAQGAGQDPSTSGLAQGQPPTAVPEVIPEPPPTKRVAEVLESGVLITISLASQQMHVFRDGVLWRSSPVSTGKRGKETPPGVFAIPQKKKFHRSNLYSNAPMPFMQRLTWDGIAIHAGQLPGYPASHGCIRIPRAFASELFAITGPTTTAVIVIDEPLANEAEALALAKATDALVPIDPELLLKERQALAQAPDKPAEIMPAARSIPAPPVAQTVPLPTPTPTFAAKGQTIQLAATLTPELAATQWEQLSARRPELRAMQMVVIPAVVNGTQYYRLRASAPDAHARCRALKRSGIDCFPVS